ncbi:MAG: hypothetical protein K2Q17_14515, partial [Nitrospiraceae bacterium]|nr:hypothetical protein [Nitrospiraceae bacterium]
SKYQASILAFLFERLPIREDVDSMEFSLSGQFAGKYHVAHAAIKTVEKARIVFTLPSYSHSVFLALTRINATETARLLANLEDYERESAHNLRLGEVVVTPDQVLQGYEMPFAVILLRTATSSECSRVPDHHEIDGKQTFFFLVTPLTRTEWEIRRKSGHDVLMNNFEASRKDLFL